MAPAHVSKQHDSPWDIVQAEIAQQRWNRYKTTMIPVENQWMANTESLNSPLKSDEAAGLATSGVMKEASPMMDQQKSQMINAGVNPNSGAYIMGRADMGNKLADATGSADLNARMGQKNRYLQGLQNIVSIGNNQAGTAQQSLSDVANMARASAMNNIEYGALQNQAAGNAAGTGVGLAISAYGNKR